MAEKDKFDEFLDEVEQDIRQEKFMSLWNKYGKVATYVASALLVLVAGVSLWNQHAVRQKNLTSDQLMTAHTLLLEEKKDEAIGVLKRIEKDASKGAYRDFATFLLAAVHSEDQKKPQDAIAIYTKIAQSPDIMVFLKDLAVLNSIRLQMDMMSTISEKQAVDWVQSLDKMTTAQHAWGSFANEMKAFILFKTKQLTKAREVYANLVRNDKTPKHILSRARLMIQVINSKVA